MSRRGASCKKRSAESERYIERREREKAAKRKQKAKQAKKHQPHNGTYAPIGACPDPISRRDMR